MFGSTILEVAIGLSFVYLLLSLIVTTIQELIATWLGLRARNLQQAIQRMLDDDEKETNWKTFFMTIPRVFITLINSLFLFFGYKKVFNSKTRLSSSFFTHPLIKYLASDKLLFTKPSYIKPESFVKVLMDTIRYKEDLSNTKTPNQDIEKGISEISVSEDTAKLLRTFWADADQDINKFELKLENWFNETMERASGWYNRKAKQWTFIIAIAVTIFSNADSVYIIETLSEDHETRKEFVLAATNYLDKTQNDEEKELKEKTNQLIKKELDSAQKTIGFGWNEEDKQLLNKHGYFGLGGKKYLGWLITILAISLGAPFWFDFLNKLMHLRGTGTSSKPKDAN